jgi:Fe2+ or Zn2+ uptake regulation protein
LQEEVARKLRFTIQYHKLELYGQCSDCRADVRRGTGRVRALGAR